METMVWILVVVGFIGALVVFPRFRKYVIVTIFPGPSETLGLDKALIQIKEDDKWKTVQKVDDISAAYLYAFDAALARYPGVEVRVLDRVGKVCVSPIMSPLGEDQILVTNAKDTDSVIGSLERLQKLKEAGILTDAEFQQQKSALLN